MGNFYRAGKSRKSRRFLGRRWCCHYRCLSGDTDSPKYSFDTQFEMLAVSVTRNFENIHYQYLVGGIPESAWAGWSFRIVNFLGQPGVKVWWGHHQSAYSPEFRSFVESGMGDLENPGAVLISSKQ